MSMETSEQTLPKIEFRPSTRTAHRNRESRLGNHISRTTTPFSDDSFDEVLGEKEKKKPSNATYLGTSRSEAVASRDSFSYLDKAGSSTFRDDIFSEEPLMRKFARKVTMANSASSIFTKARSDAIRKHRTTYSKACRILKISELRNFVKQIGDRRISMSNQCLSWKELNAIISVLVTDEFTTSLDLGGNNLNINAVGYIKQLLDCNKSLTNLNLENNKFYESGLEKLTDVLSASKHVTHLSLAGNQLTDNHAPCIAKLIQVSTKITELDLSHNELRVKGGLVIGDALGKNDDLLKLNLSWNHLRGKGAECIAMGLLKNSTLVSLDISWNGFGYDGCVAMAHALRSNTTLTELDISFNRIHPPALYEFLKGLMHNKTLVKLKMGGNPITAIATTPLMCCIRDTREMALEEIDLQGVVVDKEFEFVLQEIRETRPRFRAVYDVVLPVHKDKDKWMEREKEKIRQAGDVIFNVDPVKILYYTQQNLRVVDLFHQMDADGSNRLSREEIREGLKKADFHLSSSAIDAIFNYLDADNDGEIDLKEFLNGSRNYKRAAIAEKQYQEARQKIEIEEGINNISADPGGAQSRFSTSFRPALKTGDDFMDRVMNSPNKKSRNSVKLPRLNDNSNSPHGVSDVKQ